ncbi:MAG TPA: HNH endonuclease [Roseomonas sp.]|nr:HNH endonuclease [Roseomonas sp.]
MKRNSSRKPIRTTDPDGSLVVLVPLSRGGYACVDVETHDELVVRLGFSDKWMLNFNGQKTAAIVRCSHPKSEATGSLLSIGRLVYEAPPGYAVRHRDGDTKNLRRSNLYLVEHPRAGSRELSVLQRRRAEREMSERG